VRVVADTHALVWYLADSQKLSRVAADALGAAEADEGILVSAATLIDLWYVVHRATTDLTADHVSAVEDVLREVNNVHLVEIDAHVVACFGETDGLRDPWDRLIVATALSYEAPLVTRDRAVMSLGAVPVIW
jgi:PIN domain nuclease of toxin-antitoxin system